MRIQLCLPLRRRQEGFLIGEPGSLGWRTKKTSADIPANFQLPEDMCGGGQAWCKQINYLVQAGWTKLC
eukprot:9261549-Pyramimonas_sp.AAC.1